MPKRVPNNNNLWGRKKKSGGIKMYIKQRKGEK